METGPVWCVMFIKMSMVKFKLDDVVDYQSFKGCSYCIIWQHTIKITTVQTFWYYHKMYRHSVPVKRWWPLNWQIMSQPECHNFKILLQTTNNFTSDEIFRQNRIKICENTSVFILFGNVFFDANNRSRGARAAARETNSFTLQLWLWNNMPFLQFHNFNLFKSFWR